MKHNTCICFHLNSLGWGNEMCVVRPIAIQDMKQQTVMHSHRDEEETLGSGLKRECRVGEGKVGPGRMGSMRLVKEHSVKPTFNSEQWGVSSRAD